MTTTNYFNTLTEPAEDCKVHASTIPGPKGGQPTVALLQYQKIIDSPYEFDSDDVLFNIYAKRHDIENTYENKKAFFAKGQPCFRSSPLTKQYGWCVHSNADGNIALVNVGSEEHKKLKSDDSTTKIKAMRNKKA